MMESNPFRPAQRESYEQQLDLSAPPPKMAEEENEELLVDVGLSASTNAAASQQPKFLDSSSSALLPPPGGPLGPSPRQGTGGGNVGGNQNGGSGEGGLISSASSRLCGFFSVEYYRPYFDVSSAIVLERMKSGMSPHKADLFESSNEAPADLYGAVWISLTLIFLIGATSNLNSYFAHASSSTEQWERDYTLVPFATSIVLAYTFVVPLLVWGASLYVGVDPRPSLTKMIGIYGYIITIFVPTSLLCAIPSAAVQWIVVILAGSCSGIVLIRNLWRLFGANYSSVATNDTEAQTSLTGSELTGPPSRARTSFLLICFAGLMHAVFSLMLKLFFFQGAELAGVVSDDKTGAA